MKKEDLNKDLRKYILENEEVESEREFNEVSIDLWKRLVSAVQKDVRLEGSLKRLRASFVEVTGLAYLIISSLIILVFGIRNDEFISFIVYIFLGLGCLFVINNIIIFTTKAYRKKIRKRVEVVEEEYLKKFENIKKYGYENVGGSSWQNGRIE